MYVDDKGQFGGDSDHHPFFIVLKEQTCVKKMFKQLVPDKIVWDIKENQDWTEYASDVIVRSASLDSTSVDSLMEPCIKLLVLKWSQLNALPNCLKCWWMNFDTRNS